MKIIDRSRDLKQPDNNSLIKPFQGAVKHGFSRLNASEAEEVCIAALGNILSDEYTLLRNITLSNLEVAIPLILIGPGGLFVFQVSTLIGSFRAKEENWLSLENLKNPKPIQPNLLVRTSLMARAVDVFLSKNKVAAPSSQGVLFCANPRMFVECIHPIVQVVMGDTLELFAVNFAKDSSVLNSNKQIEILELLVPSVSTEPNLDQNIFEDSPPVSSREENVSPTRTGWRLDFKFSRGQLVTLLVIAFFEIVVIAIIIFITLRSLAQ
jgi:hypothetical protein